MPVTAGFLKSLVLYNINNIYEVVGIANAIPCPSNSKVHGKEPQNNKTSV